MVTMMAGVILLFLGFTGLGTAVRFIPRPIVIGFTNGIALLIASTQIKDFFGLKMRRQSQRVLRPPARPGRTPRHHRIRPLGDRLGLAGAHSASCPYCSRACPDRSSRCSPATLVAAALPACPSKPSAANSAASAAPSRPSTSREFRADLILPLLPSALTVAILAALESLLSAVVADSHERRSPQFQRRAGRAGLRQHASRRCSAESPSPAPSRAPPPTSAPARSLRSPA